MNWIHEDGRMFCLNRDGELLAELTYVFSEKREAVINHTFVHPAHRGEGIAGRMMEAFVAHLRARKLTASATCPFAHAWLKKNRELLPDIISKQPDDDNTACRAGGQC